MATTQSLITATSVAATTVALDSTRRMLHIKNYFYQPGTTTAQTGVIYVAFGKVATLGTAGELELIPGGEYTYGGPLPPNKQTLPGGFILPVCPQEYISVITATGTMYGFVMTQ
jgi:hypothetical protein